MNLKFSYIVLVGSALILISIGVFAGPTNTPFEDVLKGLMLSSDGMMDTIVWSIRIPRIFVSLLVGGCLGLAGILIQLSTRSSLGDPNLFGIGGGATIYIACIAAGLVSLGEPAIFLGCITCSTLVALLLTRLISSADLSPVKLAIMGIAIGALTITIGTSVISHGRVFPTQVIGLLSGSFTSSSWSVIYYICPAFIACLSISIIFARRFYPIMLGDILSKSLGVSPMKTRSITMVLVGVLSGASVFGGGLIGFVGLASPHIARRLLGNTPRHLIIGSASVGAITTIFADQLARLLFSPIELPVGMATTLLGAPMMIYLALRIK